MKKKICFLTDSIFSIGGVQRVTAVIAKALAADHHVTIITQDEPAKKDTSLYDLHKADISYRFFHFHKAPRLKNLCCQGYSYLYRTLLYRIGGGHDWFLQCWASEAYAHSSFPANQRATLTELLREGGYDVVVGVHAPMAARLATVRKQFPDTMFLGWIHNSFEALFGSGSLYLGPDRLRHYLYQLRQLDETIVLCQYDANVYRRHDSQLTPRVIYNPLTLVPGAVSKGQSKQFLAVGRFSPKHKGFDLLIDAFRLFCRHDSDWTLHIVGEGPEEALYREKIAAYGLEERIQLHPFTANVQQYYSAAQVYVLSSRWEGFGLVLVEAMAHGLPVVSSDLPTSREIMGDFGLYFPVGDVEAMAQRLYDATRLDWQAKAEQAQRIAAQFHIDNIIKQWQQIITKASDNG